MSSINWTRAAYLFFVLAVLAALAKLGAPEAATRSFVIEPRGEKTTVSETETVTERTSRTAVRAAPAIAGPASTRPSARHERHESHERPDREPSRVFLRAKEEVGPPVFYRPAPGPAIGAPAVAGRASGPICGDLGDFPGSSRIVFPLAREHFSSYEDTWGAPRPQGGHEGTDLMVPAGTPLFAITDATVVPVSGANANGWNALGGYTVMLEAAYDIGPVRKGDLFYYAHMDRESALPVGTRVRAGQVVGHAGDTGQGPEVTRGLFPPHLHLGWYDTTGARTELASGAMNPFPLLEWIKASGGSVRGGSDARYCQAPQSGIPTPSTGQSYWPFPNDPGVRPDMDTGSSSPKPSPVVERTPRSPERDPGAESKPRKNPSRTPVVEETTVRQEVRAPGDDRAEPRVPPRGEPADVSVSLPESDGGDGWRQRLRRALERVHEAVSRMPTDRTDPREARSERPASGPEPGEDRPGAKEERRGSPRRAPSGAEHEKEHEKADGPCRDERPRREHKAPVEGSHPPAGGEATAQEKTSGVVVPETTSSADEAPEPEAGTPEARRETTREAAPSPPGISVEETTSGG